jgi:PKD repeat protein
MRKFITLTFLLSFLLSPSLYSQQCGVATDEAPGCLMCSPVYTGKTAASYSPSGTPLPCGTVQGDQWLSFIADRNNATVSITATNCTNFPSEQGFEAQVYDANLNPVSPCFSSGGLVLNANLNATGLTPGNRYSIRIDGFDGDVCEITVVVDGIRIKFDRLDQDVRATPDLATYCPGQIVEFAIDSLPGSTGVNWTVPGGANILSGQGTSTITVQLLSVGGGVVCATPFNDCFMVAPYCKPFTVAPIPPTVIPPQEVCQEDFPITIGNQTFTGPGIYNRFLQSQYGCDSLVIYTLINIVTPPTFLPPVTFCLDDFPIVYNGTRFTRPGLFSITYNSSKGCDSLVNYFILGLPPSTFVVDTTICEGECFEIANNEFCTQGNYDIILQDAAQNGCDSTIKVLLTVNNPASVIQPAGQLGCDAGSTVTLSGAGSSTGQGVTYRWRAGNGGSFVGPTNNLTATVDEPANYFLDVIKVVNGVTCIATDTVEVTINTVVPADPVFATNPAGVCEGTMSTYTVNAISNADNYTFTIDPASPFTQNGNSITVTWAQAGIATICAIASNDCGDSKETCINVEVTAIPESSFTAPDSICLNDAATIAYDGNAGPGATYNWGFNGGVASAGGQGPFTVTWATPGIKAVSLTVDENGCTSTSTSKNVTVISPLQAPVINCNSTINSINFTWNPVPNANDYEVFINGTSQGTQAGTSFDVTGLMPNESAEIMVVANGNQICGPSMASLTCQAQECPPLDITLTPVASICRDASSMPVQIQYDLDGDNGSGTLTWSGTGVDQNGNFDPNSANLGTNTIILTYVKDGCSYTESIGIDVFEAPEATFSADQTICVNATSTLSYTGNASQNANYTWTFDGGNNENGATGAGPYEISWPASGSYNVNLVVEENGCVSDQQSLAVQVDAELDKPVLTCEPNASFIDFSWDPVTGGDDYTVNVLSGNSGTQNGNSYTVGGLLPNESVTIELVVSGMTVCGPSRDTITCETNDCPPVDLNISPVPAICLDGDNGIITLDATATGGDGSGTFTWSGPGVSANGELDGDSPDLIPGSTNRIRVVYEENDCIFNASFDLQVNEKPQANFNAESPICIDEASTIAYTGNIITGADYQWDFGGGTPGSVTGPGPHDISFTESGNRDVSLVVVNQNCPSDTITSTIQIDLPLQSPNVVCDESNTEIVFNWDPVTGVTDYTVNVLQGQTGTFDGFGSYTVSSLTPGDSVTIEIISEGDTDCGPIADTIKCYADDCLSPIPDFGFTIDEATVTFENMTQNGLTYSWTFGDGGMSTDENPVHTYPSNGTYPVTLFAYNDCDTVSTFTNVTINGTLPEASFTANVRRFCAPDTVRFTDNSPGNPTEWSWSFPGGTPAASTDQNPVVVYNTPGAYGVSLNVTNAFGSNNITQTAYIIVEEQPVADFTTAISDLTVQFTNTSTGGITFSWDFGDGNSSFDESPEHTYAEAGDYTVTLTITNSCGTEMKTETIKVDPSSATNWKFLNKFVVYPNPNDGNFILELAGDPADNLRIDLFNVIGQKVYGANENFRSGQLKKVFRQGNLQSGMYTLQITEGDKSVYHKIIVE